MIACLPRSYFVTIKFNLSNKGLFFGEGSQIHTRDPRTCTIFTLAWGSYWGSSRNQNNCGLSGTYISCIHCGLSVKTNTRKTPHDDRNAFVLHCFWVCVVGKNPKTPKLSPMADLAITQVCIGSLGSLLYIMCENYK